MNQQKLLVKTATQSGNAQLMQMDQRTTRQSNYVSITWTIFDFSFPPYIYIYTLENTISIDSANSAQVFLSIDFLTQFHDFKLWTGSSGPKIFSCGHLELEWFFGATKKGIG